MRSHVQVDGYGGTKGALNVLVTAGLVNDNYASAASAATPRDGTTVGATRESGEPSPWGNIGASASVWYSLQVPAGATSVSVRVCVSARPLRVHRVPSVCALCACALGSVWARCVPCVCPVCALCVPCSACALPEPAPVPS